MEIIFTNKKEGVMPGFDGTGPNGQGAMTGGGGGYCAVNVHAERGPRGTGRGFGGRGGRRGFRNCFYATGLPGWMRARDRGTAANAGGTLTPEAELALLREQEARYASNLAILHARVRELEQNEADERSGT